MKKKILIIGSGGYLGRYLNSALKDKYNIFCPNKKKLDITKLENLKKYFHSDLDFIINLSGQVSSKSNLMKKVIIKGNENLIKICKNEKTTIFYLSTSLVYGYSKISKIESSIKKPVDSYSKFKHIAEEKYFKSNVSYKILRICNVFNGKQRGIVRILKNSIRNKKKIILTNTEVYRNYIHIKDLTKIILNMIETKLKYNLYNIGFQNVKIRNLISSVERSKNIKINYENKKIPLKKIPSQKISSNRIFKEIKYKPKIKITNYIIN